MGVQATVLNSTQFLDRAGRSPGDPHGLHLWPGSLILVDEASMLPASHAAAIKRFAAGTRQQGDHRRGRRNNSRPWKRAARWGCKPAGDG